MNINVYCYGCSSRLDIVEEYADGYPFSGITLKIEPCPECSRKNDIEPDYVELLNNEVKWHEENIVQDETEKQSAFIKGIKQARFLIAKAERELTKRALDAATAAAQQEEIKNNSRNCKCVVVETPRQ